MGGGCLSQCVRAKKNFWGRGKFGRLLWDQGFEYVTGTGSQKKTFRTPESFFGFRGTRGSNMSLFGPPKVFFSIATKSGMTASAYLVNFKINLGDLAEVVLIWPDIMTCIMENTWKQYTEYTNSYEFHKTSRNKLRQISPRRKTRRASMPDTHMRRTW